MSRLKYGSVISVIIGAILVTACGNTTTTDRTQNDRNEGQSVQSSEAEIIYKKKCMSCHGTDLQGRRGPSLQNIGSRLTENEILEIVTNGRKGMPRFENNIPAEDIQLVSKWMSELK
ncbi:c-type cytochrome [Paenibacillus sinopodophylli]|uniref:c-type cytochrome n=1 Tax=Paenibacillus sinopodophylli TaxID=1837342 RepID=UPI00110CCB34|nr:cytochrome c [Paenibacillus sinopodophylli]